MLKTPDKVARGEKMKWRGFTLVELLVALAVGAILLTIAIPGYAFLVNASRLATATNDLVTTLHLARSEAIKRGIRVTVCKTSSPGAVTPACDATASWQQGWLVFVDGDTRGVIDGGDLPLWVQHRSPPEVSITSTEFDAYISYLPNGRSQRSQNENFSNGRISVCAAGNRRDIVINNAGRPKLETHTC
jgi:type IV fimbrial biogenesis protein FimT